MRSAEQRLGVVTRGVERRERGVRWLVAAFCALMLAASHACLAVNTLAGRVISIADGDTITVLDAQKRQWRIRLAAIDAPEHGQAYGSASRQALAARVFRRDVIVQWSHFDKYDRVLGKVMVDGVDVNLAQIADGMAWHYRQYAREQSAEDRRAYQVAEEWARKRGVGLWADAHPVPPWKFRHE